MQARRRDGTERERRREELTSSKPSATSCCGRSTTSRRARGGDIDDESYAALHDDYTARAAAVIRALRDGVDARPARTEAPPAGGGSRSSAASSSSRASPRVALAAAVGARLPGQTSSGNRRSTPRPTHRRRIESLQHAVSANPDELRPAGSMLAEAFAEQRRPRRRAQAVRRRRSRSIRTGPRRSRSAGGIAVPRRAAASRHERAGPVVGARRAARLDQAIEVGPGVRGRLLLPRRAACRTSANFARAQADLQTYLAQSPNGTWRSSASSARSQVTTALAERLVDYACPRPPDPEETLHGRAARPEIDTPKIYRTTITTDRGTIVMDLDPRSRRTPSTTSSASRGRATTTGSRSTASCPSS